MFFKEKTLEIIKGLHITKSSISLQLNDLVAIVFIQLRLVFGTGNTGYLENLKKEASAAKYLGQRNLARLSVVTGNLATAVWPGCCCAC